MNEKLINYINDLKKEYNLCIETDNKLTEERSDNYYYHTRAQTIDEVIYGLLEIIKANE